MEPPPRRAGQRAWRHLTVPLKDRCFHDHFIDGKEDLGCDEGPARERAARAPRRRTKPRYPAGRLMRRLTHEGHARPAADRGGLCNASGGGRGDSLPPELSMAQLPASLCHMPTSMYWHPHPCVLIVFSSALHTDREAVVRMEVPTDLGSDKSLLLGSRVGAPCCTLTGQRGLGRSLGSPHKGTNIPHERCTCRT